MDASRIFREPVSGPFPTRITAVSSIHDNVVLKHNESHCDRSSSSERLNEKTAAIGARGMLSLATRRSTNSHSSTHLPHGWLLELLSFVNPDISTS